MRYLIFILFKLAVDTLTWTNHATLDEEVSRFVEYEKIQGLIFDA